MRKSSAGLDCGKRLAGHSAIQMTSSIYGHLMPDRDRAHVNRRGKIILSNSAHSCTREKTIPLTPPTPSHMLNPSRQRNLLFSIEISQLVENLLAGGASPYGNPADK